MTATETKTMDYIEHYLEHGYVRIPGVYSQEEISPLADAIDRIKENALAGLEYYGLPSFHIDDDPNLGRNLRAAFWPGYIEDICDAFRTDLRMLEIVRPMLGENIKSLTHQIHWKTPGSLSRVAIHTDYKNRINFQGDNIRNVESSFVQTAVAIDPMSSENGALVVYPRSHLAKAEYEDFNLGNYTQEKVHLEPIELGGTSYEPLELVADVGDVVLWHPKTLHASQENNHATMDRRLFINGYVDARHCFNGAWTFLRGNPTALPPADVCTMINTDQGFNPFPDNA